MKRPGAVDKTLERIQRWRGIAPDITIRSTFIVGFPGETEAEFEELLDFLDEAQLDRVGAFAYSPVEGAKANALPDPVPEAGEAGAPGALHGAAGGDLHRQARGQGRHDPALPGRRARRRTRDRALDGRCAGDRRPGADPERLRGRPQAGRLRRRRGSWAATSTTSTARSRSIGANAGRGISHDLGVGVLPACCAVRLPTRAHRRPEATLDLLVRPGHRSEARPMPA